MEIPEPLLYPRTVIALAEYYVATSDTAWHQAREIAAGWDQFFDRQIARDGERLWNRVGPSPNGIRFLRVLRTYFDERSNR